MLIYTRNDPRFYDKRLYKGGGGDGGAAQMRADEAARQARVKAAIEAINTVFGQGNLSAPTREAFTNSRRGALGLRINDFDQAGYDAALAQHERDKLDATKNGVARQKQYDDLGAAVTATNVRDLDKQFSTASKENKYGLARIGQLGGSVAADSEADLMERYGEGKIKATALGSEAASNLKISDEKTRQNLISLAQSGLDTGVASNMATQQLSAAQQAANATANTSSIGNLFEGLTQAYILNQRRNAGGVATPQSNPYGGNSSLWGNKAVGIYQQ